MTTAGRWPRLALLAVLAGGGCATSGFVGKAAPDFTLPALGGGEVKLAALRGQVVVIDFWASWCGPCREELPELEKLRPEYEPRGVRFVAINVDDDAAAAAAAARQLALAMPVGMDAAKKTAEAYAPPAMPSSYVVDRAGTVRFVHEGFAGSPDIARFRRELDELLR